VLNTHLSRPIQISRGDLTPDNNLSPRSAFSHGGDVSPGGWSSAVSDEAPPAVLEGNAAGDDGGWESDDALPVPSASGIIASSSGAPEASDTGRASEPEPPVWAAFAPAPGPPAPAPLAGQAVARAASAGATSASVARDPVTVSLAYSSLVVADLPEWTHRTVRLASHLLAGSAPEHFPDSDSGQCLDYMFTSRLAANTPLRTNTWAAEAAAAGAGGNGPLYQKRFFETAQLVLLLSRLFWASYAAKALDLIESGTAEGILLLFVGASDEASSKLRVPEETTTDSAPQPPGRKKVKTQNATTAKIVQSELRVGILLRNLASGEYVYVTGMLPCALAAVDRTTSECMYKVHQDTYTLPGFTDLFMNKFKNICICHTQDKCSSNEKIVHVARSADLDVEADNAVKQRTRLYFPCDIHRGATLSTRVFDLFKCHISGMLALAISERGAGRFEDLRKLVADECLARLRIVRGVQLDPDASRHRTAFLDVVRPRGSFVDEDTQAWLPGSMSQATARFLYDSLFNGDIRDSEHVWHHAPVDGPSDDDIRLAFKQHAALALLPAMMNHFPRHRWTGAHKVICSATLFAGTHGLLHTVMPKWLDPVGKRRKALAESRVAQAVAVEDGYASESEHVENPAPAVHAAASASADQSSHERWVAWNEENRGNALVWALSDPHVVLRILAIVALPISKLIEDFLRLAGEKWDTFNDWATANGHARRFRVVDACQLQTERRCVAQVLLLMQDPALWNSLPAACLTLASRGLAFRSLIRIIGGLRLLLVAPREGFPFALFKLLADVGLAGEILAAPACMRDDFTQHHITRYGADLGGQESLFVLASVAESLRLDTSRVEAGHSFWQREARVKGLQTIADSLPSVSATWVLHKQRLFEFGKSKRPRVGPRRRARVNKSAPKRAAAKLRGWRKAHNVTRHGGGGAWRAFVSRNARKGLFRGAVFSGLSVAYRAIQGTPAFAEYTAVGVAATHARATSEMGNPLREMARARAPLPEHLPAAVPLPVADPAGVLVPVAVIGALAPYALGQGISVARLVAMARGKSVLRKACLKIAAECHKRDEAAASFLESWSEQQLALASSASQGRPAFGVASPCFTGLHKFECPAPAIAAASHILRAANEPSSVSHADGFDSERHFSFHKALRDAWMSEHALLKHSSLPALGPSRPSPLSTSVCRFFGMCVCEREDLRLFRASLLTLLKPMFKKAPANSLKALCEDGFVFLRLEWSHGVEGSPSHFEWFHITFANQNSWALVFTRALPDPDPSNVRVAAAAGHIALRIALPAALAADPFEACDSDLVPRIFAQTDIRRVCRSSLYELVECAREVLSFTPAELEVRPRPGTAVDFWPGARCVAES
jgi:hypothetical protein